MSPVAAPETQRRILAIPAASAMRIVPVRRRREARPLPRVRGDSLPEQTRYRDDGCDIHGECLSCPLERCRYEERGGLRAVLNAPRDRQIVFLKGKGVPVEKIAGRFGVSRRTVFRIVETAAQRRREEETLTIPLYLRRESGEVVRLRVTTEEAQCA